MNTRTGQLERSAHMFHCTLSSADLMLQKSRLWGNSTKHPSCTLCVLSCANTSQKLDSKYEQSIDNKRTQIHTHAHAQIYTLSLTHTNIQTNTQYTLTLARSLSHTHTCRWTHTDQDTRTDTQTHRHADTTYTQTHRRTDAQTHRRTDTPEICTEKDSTLPAAIGCCCLCNMRSQN